MNYEQKTINDFCSTIDKVFQKFDAEQLKIIFKWLESPATSRILGRDLGYSNLSALIQKGMYFIERAEINKINKKYEDECKNIKIKN